MPLDNDIPRSRLTSLIEREQLRTVALGKAARCDEMTAQELDALTISELVELYFTLENRINVYECDNLAYSKGYGPIIAKFRSIRSDVREAIERRADMMGSVNGDAA